MPGRLSAITIDVDSLRFYRQIHGLEESGAAIDDPIYGIAIPRFFELLEAAHCPATLFLIGQDAPAHAAVFGPLEASRSEIASHSFAHDYHLSVREPEQIRSDLVHADQALRPLNGGRPLAGFRAPGYNVTPALLSEVLALHYRYDSSLLPSPWYFGARWSAIRAYRLLGRRSESLRGNYRQFRGPLSPYPTEVETPWLPSADGPLFELPMACHPLTRLPLFGTSWVMMPALAQRVALDMSLGRVALFNFEMHAIDLLDGSDHPSLGAIKGTQPGLTIPAKDKLASFRRLFHRLADETEVLTLAEASARLRP